MKILPNARRLCPGVCLVLSAERKTRGSDPSIPIEHAECAWSAFAPHVRRTVVNTLAALPLHLLCMQLKKAQISVIRSPHSVRRELARDNELIQDLTQDVGLAMIQAIHRGAIGAARPIVYVWIQRTGYWITCEKSKAAALSLLTGTQLSDHDGSDESRSPEPPPLAGLTGRPLADTEELEDVLDVRTQLKEVMFSSVPANLTDAQELVFTRWLEGINHKRIAEELGITEVASRLQLMKALRLMRATKQDAA